MQFRENLTKSLNDFVDDVTAEIKEALREATWHQKSWNDMRSGEIEEMKVRLENVESALFRSKSTAKHSGKKRIK